MSGAQHATEFLNDYANELGRLVGNLASLELAIRLVLYTIDTPEERKLPHGKMTFPPGTQAPLNWFTSWHPLGALIAKYNELNRSSGTIPEDIKDLRDAFAHGRVFGIGPEPGAGEFHLVRSSKPDRDVVTVELDVTLTPQFVRQQSAKVRATAEIVNARQRSLAG